MARFGWGGPSTFWGMAGVIRSGAASRLSTAWLLWLRMRSSGGVVPVATKAKSRAGRRRPLMSVRGQSLAAPRPAPSGDQTRVVLSAPVVMRHGDAMGGCSGVGDSRAWAGGCTPSKISRQSSVWTSFGCRVCGLFTGYGLVTGLLGLLRAVDTVCVPLCRKTKSPLAGSDWLTYQRTFM